ncbi:MAG: LysE family translocator [Bacteriovoracaceae bacterium]
MDFNLISTILTLHFVALITPGPDFALTVKNSLNYGKRCGIYTAIGFALGIALHVSYSILGVAVLLNTFPKFFNLIKISGALYIIWIGLQTLSSIKSSNSDFQFDKVADQKVPSPLIGLKQGFFTNILNPKVTLFILGLFVSVIPAGTQSTTLIISGLLMCLITFLWFAGIAYFFGWETIRRAYLKAQKGINFVFGVFFLLAGVLLLVK